MRRKLSVVGFIALSALCACKKPAPVAEWFGGSPGSHGRYEGVGIYAPGQPWTRMVAAQQPNDTPAAKPIDDQVIIVVEDSVTGEVRACGDLTGYCIGMNPWKTQLTAGQITPINLTEHVKPPPPPEQAAPSEPPRRASRHAKDETPAASAGPALPRSQ
jgi:hypothetical protein